MMEISARQRIVCGVDWAMVRAAVAEIDDATAQAFEELKLLRTFKTDPPLDALTLATPIAGQAGGMPSTIRHRLRVPISTLRDSAQR